MYMSRKQTVLAGCRQAYLWLLAIALLIFAALSFTSVRFGCRRPCVDGLILYHEDDQGMFVGNGVLLAAKKHLLGVRNIFIISKSDKSFRHLLDDRTHWFDERLVPFSPKDWEGRKSGRPLGWLYQQTIKLWAVQYLPGMCNNILILDSDTLWIRDFDVVTPGAGGECRHNFKYNVASAASGAWEGDIVNPEYHHFVEYVTGLPKARKDEVTAIHHWQLMQRDVVQALARSVKSRHNVSVHEAMVRYGLEHGGMSEYEAYFSFAWHFYQDRMDVTNVPYVMREPKLSEASLLKSFRDQTIIAYFTCHDNYQGGDFYTNCRGQEALCVPPRHLSRTLIK